MADNYKTKRKDFLEGRIKGCRAFFEENAYYSEAAYCCIILDNLGRAKELFTKAKDYDIRSRWGLFVLQLINGEITSSPTYLELRNFLELDISMLITYCKEDYLQKIVRYADYMSFYNPECYKFIGRVFWAHNYEAIAMYFLDKAKSKLYMDPELHYLLAYIYYQKKNYNMCRKSLDACLDILPEYYPAKKLKTTIG